jgi:hypothetical protein
VPVYFENEWAGLSVPALRPFNGPPRPPLALVLLENEGSDVAYAPGWFDAAGISLLATPAGSAQMTTTVNPVLMEHPPHDIDRDIKATTMLRSEPRRGPA